jgi:4-hydroxy-tetrahydrodipicolinate synthase
MSVTPFTGDGALDLGRLRAHVQFLAAGGVGVYVASQGSGEGDLLSGDERVAVYGAAAGAGVAVPVVAAGIGLGMRTTTACALARAAEAGGCDGVQVLGPRPGALPPTPGELDAYFRTVIEAVTCAVHVSSNPMLTGYSLPLDLIERLVADYPHVRVVCITERDPAGLYAYVNVLAARVDVRIGVTGELRACQDLGASGLLSFEANVAPHLAAGAWADDDAYRRLRQLNAALSLGGTPRSLKAVLDAGPLRDPYLPLATAEVDRLREAVRALS